MADAALHTWGARALLAAFADGGLSPVEVMRSVLAQMDRWEPHLHASYLWRPEAALAAARASEDRWRRKAPCGPLDGVPVTLKDNIATRGAPMPLGTRATSSAPLDWDAPAAARLREAGAITVCKTTMPDYGMLSSGLSSFHATARNPWNLSRTPGGSSAGAGAAAAAAYGPLHLGTDIGGSIRLPAGWCGVFGLKPSLGRVPIDPPYTGRAAGPMTRRVDDASLMMAVLSQPDARDSMALPPAPDLRWPSHQDRPLALKGLRLGLLLDAGCGLALEPSTRAAIERAAQQLAAEGAEVVPMAPFLTRTMLDGMDHFWRMRSWRDMANLTAEQKDSVLPYIRQWADSAAAFDGVTLYEAASQFHRCRVETVKACAGLDFVLSPVSPVPAFAADWASPTNDPLRPLEHIAFTVPFNMSEQPAASVPCGFTDDGLPIGLQIAGQRFDDVGVLRLAMAYEGLRGPLRPYPEPPAA